MFSVDIDTQSEQHESQKWLFFYRRKPMYKMTEKEKAKTHSGKLFVVQEWEQQEKQG
jgi:hypothetical protein